MELGTDFDDAILGHGLPPEAEAALKEAGLHRSDAPRAMGALMRAQRLAGEHPAVLIALYRHYFYGHQLAAARDVARRALVVAAQGLQIPKVWRHVRPEPMPGARFDVRTRFYLFTLKGYAYLSLRLGDDAEARDALALLAALDPEDRVGGAVIEQVRLRRGVDEDDDAPARKPAFGAAAWKAVSDMAASMGERLPAHAAGSTPSA